MRKTLIQIRKSIQKVGTCIICVVLLQGCAVVNFSANYYTPPENYQDEVASVFLSLTKQLNLKHSYSVVITSGEDSDRMNGVPAIAGKVVLLPEDFVKYVYQNYYNDRNKILASVIAHEVCHKEFNLPSEPWREHYKTDQAALEVLGGDDTESSSYYYWSLVVMKNYWFARKGMAGHALNAGWNVANAATSAVFGIGYLKDWFATDLNKRLRLIRKNYQIQRTNIFRRSVES